jgi:hypothetical protein
MLSLLAAALTQCTSGVAQNPPDYTLSIVARTGDTIDKHKLLYLGSPAINNKGEIVFTARFADRPEPECRWVSATAVCNSAIITVIGAQANVLKKSGDAIDKQALTGIADPVALNDSGTVAFAAGTAALDSRAALGRHGIFTQNQLIAQPGDKIDGCTISEIGSSGQVLLDPRPAIDQLDTVFFSANSFGPCRAGSIASNLFTKRRIITAGQRAIGFFGVSRTGLVAALTDHGIFVNPTAPTRGRSGTIVQNRTRIDGHVVEGIGPPAINDVGHVAFAGQFDCSRSECSNFLATALHIVAKPSDLGVRVSEFQTPAINNRDVIVCRALVAPEKFLLFAVRPGVSPQLSVIAKPGDMIDGKTLFSVGRSTIAGYVGINDAGLVVFLGTFTDGSQAIVLATPVTGRRPSHQ